jgi:hypothetical protein
MSGRQVLANYHGETENNLWKQGLANKPGCFEFSLFSPSSLQIHRQASMERLAGTKDQAKKEFLARVRTLGIGHAR